jgi:hypothetical protein
MFGYALIAVTLVIGLAINYDQTQDIKDTANALKETTTALFKRDCDLVVSTATVFTDFIRKEIMLRDIRASEPGVDKAVRAFDQAEVNYWMQHTLPELSRVYAVKCAAAKAANSSGG